MRFDTSVPLKKRYKLSLGEFRGVDYSSPALRVAKNHATFAQNLICVDGLNHKRHGWCEQLALGARINGIFPFEEEKDGVPVPVLLVHAGTALWRVCKEDGVWKSEKISKNIKLNDARSQCFVRNGVAYFVGCGKYLAYGKHVGYEIYALVDVSEIAYVPTTTVDIHSEESGTVGSTSFESVNLLTNRRINKLVFEWWGEAPEGKVPEQTEDKTGQTLVLDGVVEQKKSFRVVFESDDGLVGECSVDSLFYDVNMKVKNPSGVLIADVFVIDNELKIRHVYESAGELKITAATVTFHVAGENKISPCRFGATFGVDGGNDRLFVSGNPRYKNKDFFSEAGDFTYFPEGNVLTVGDERSAVTGYARLSDAALAVFKEESVGDSAIYIRTGKEQAMTDLDGDTVREALFPTLAGAASEHLATPHAVANLSGDVLMLSKNGVFGIELSSNIASNERYARERGRALGTALQAQDLSEAVGVTFRGRYYLATGDGTLYVADSRYRVRLSGASDVGYEWWVWQNVPARVLAVWQDTLLFGTADGRICFFDTEYTDRSFTELGEGDVVQSGERLLFSKYVLLEDISTHDRFTAACDLFALLLDDVGEMVVTPEGAVIDFAEDKLPLLQARLRVGSEVYFDGDTAVVRATVKSIDPVALKIFFENCVDGEEMPIADASGTVLRLLQNLCSCPCGMQRDGESHVRLLDGVGEPYRLVGGYRGAASKFTARYEHVVPVVARWVSPVFDLGTDTERKTLLGLSVATDPAGYGLLTVGFESLANAVEYGTKALTLLDFGALDFDKFTFNATRIDTSFTRRFNKRNVNYVRLFFESDTDADCAVNGITLYYKINQTNRGTF